MTNQEAIWILKMIRERDAKTQAERDAFSEAIKALQKIDNYYCNLPQE